METDQTDNHHLSRVSALIAAAGLLAVVVGGYLYYQSSGDADVGAELQNPPSPGAAGTSAPGTTADATTKPGTQQVAAGAGAPMPPPPIQGSQAAPPSTNNAAATPPEPPARVPVNAQSKPSSLPTNDFAYVQKSSANLRAEPRVRAKRVGNAPKGTKLNIVRRTGKWVQVDDGTTKGWVSGNLLGPRSP